MEEFLQSIPAAAQNPYAVVAYAIAALVFLFGGAQLRMAQLLLTKITSIPEKDRRRALEIATGTVLPTHISPEQWIRHNRMRWMFLLLASLLIVLLAITAIALLKPSDDKLTDIEVATWRQQRPFGTWKARDLFSIPLSNVVLRQYGDWLHRVIEAERHSDETMLRRHGFILIEGESDLKPQQYTEAQAYSLFNIPSSIVRLRHDRSQLSPSTYLIPSTTNGEIHLQLKPYRLDITIQVDKNTLEPKNLSFYLESTARLYGGDGTVNNWLDLYGGEVIVEINDYLPEDSELLSFSIGYEDTAWPRTLTLDCDPIYRRLISKKADSEDIAYYNFLGVKQLGLIPNGYPGQLPPGYDPREYRP